MVKENFKKLKLLKEEDIDNKFSKENDKQEKFYLCNIRSLGSDSYDNKKVM